MSNCSSDILEFRDLSAWRVSIAEVRTIKTISDSNIKSYFAFVVEVQRIDVAAKTGVVNVIYAIYHVSFHPYVMSYIVSNVIIVTSYEGCKSAFSLQPMQRIFTGRGIDATQSSTTWRQN
jgi:hypothetical protein